MVLSNKKLKQKLRAELIEKTAKISLSNTSESNSTTTEIPNSFKSLATPKPRISKREKRRKTLSLHSNGENKDDAHVEENNSRGKKRSRDIKGNEGQLVAEGNGFEVEGQKTKKKKEKKRMREKDGVNGELGAKEKGSALNKEEKESKTNNKKKKKKNMKKKKKKKNEKNQDEKSKLENGAIAEEIVAEKVDYSNSQGNDEVAKKVYVGGIPYYSTEDDIRSYFDHCGTITEIDCMTFPESGKFRGIAVISFKTEEAAKRALALDGSDMGGLYLKIQPYKTTRVITKTPDFSPPIMEGYNRIYAGNLSWDITEDDLKKLFSDCNISSIRFGEDKETGEFKGYAHVDFSDNVSLAKALKLDQKIVCGRPVRISCAVPPKKGAQTKMVSTSTIPTSTVVVEGENNNNNNTNNDNNNNNYDNNNNNNNNNNDNNSNNTSGVVSSGKLKRRTCYECGEKGHISSACPNK